MLKLVTIVLRNKYVPVIHFYFAKLSDLDILEKMMCLDMSVNLCLYMYVYIYIYIYINQNILHS